MDKETKDSIANKAFQLMTEEKPNPTDNIYLSKATKKYVSAVNEVYDDKTNTTVNLMNGIVKETTLAFERMLDDAINAVNITPGNYTRIINTILDTTYTENDQGCYREARIGCKGRPQEIHRGNTTREEEID